MIETYDLNILLEVIFLIFAKDKVKAAGIPKGIAKAANIPQPS